MEDRYTTDDIFALEEGRRAELIDGRMYEAAPPKLKHKLMRGRLTATIGNYFREKKLSCKVYPSPFAVFLQDDKKNYVDPDICVVCGAEKLSERGCVGAPDWVIEIVSAESVRMDYVIKLLKYRDSGVREYWIFDPSKDRVLVYNFENEDFGEYSAKDKVGSGIFEELIIDFSKI